jgi:hypothetical protein
MSDRPPPRKNRWAPWAIALAAVLVVGPIACCLGWYFHNCVPYAEGEWNQVWTATVTYDGRTGTWESYGSGRCGEEGPRGARKTRQAAVRHACIGRGLCQDTPANQCECERRATTTFSCREWQSAAPTRFGESIPIPH